MNEDNEKRVNRFINTGIVIDNSLNENNELESLIQNDNQNINETIEQEKSIEQVNNNILEKKEDQFVKPIPEVQVFDYDTIMNNTLNLQKEESNEQVNSTSKYVNFVVETPDEPTPSFEQPVNNISVEPTPSFEQPVNNIPVEPTPSFEQPVNNISVEPSQNFEQPINNQLQSNNNMNYNFENNLSMNSNQSFNTVENNSVNQTKQTNELSINYGSNYVSSNIDIKEQERKFDYKINKEPKEKNKKPIFIIIIAAVLFLIIGVVIIVLMSGSGSKKENINTQENIQEENTNVEEIEEPEPIINNEFVESTDIALISSNENIYNFLSNLLKENGKEISSNSLKNNTNVKYSIYEYNKGTESIEVENIKYNFNYYGNSDGFYKSFIFGDKIDSILVVISDKGLDKDLKEKIQFLYTIGTRNIIVYINTKEKEGSKKLSNLEESIGKELDNIGFNNISVVDKNQTNLKQLVNIIKVPTIGEKLSEPFIMRISDTLQSTGEGMIAQGKVLSGQLLSNQEVEIVGFNETIKTKVTKIDVARKKTNSASYGEFAGIVLSDTNKDQVKIGQVVASPNSISPVKRFRAKAYIISSEMSERKEPIEEGYKPNFYFETEINGEIIIPKGSKNIKLGTITDFDIELSEIIGLEKGMTFSIRENSRMIGYGIVIDTYEE